MNDIESPFVAELLAMRSEFDQSFARAPVTNEVSLQNFLGISLGGNAFAIRLTDIAGLHLNRPIAALPTRVPTFLGVAGFRGLIVPVYDLAALLGYTEKTAPRWMILARNGDPVAFAFERFDTHFSAQSNDILPAPELTGSSPAQGRSHLFESIRTPAAIRPIIHLPSLINSFQQLPNTSLRHRRSSS